MASPKVSGSRRRGLWPALFIALGASLLAGRTASAAHVTADLIADTRGIAPGKPVTVALRLKVEKEWHIYWKNPGDAGLPISITWNLPEGFTAGPILWPHPYRFGKAPEITYGYEGEVVLPVEITPPSSWNGQPVTLRAKAAWLVCREACVSEKADVAITLSPNDSRAAAESDAIRDALSRVPAASSKLAAQAQRSGNEYLLRVTSSDPALHLPSTVYFFPADGEVIDHSAEQNPTLAGDALRLRLPVSSYASTRPARLRGVLVSGDGREGTEPTMKVEIDVPITNSEN